MADMIARDGPHAAATIAALRRLVGLMIPASDALGVPGADDERIFSDFLESARNHADALAEAVELIDKMADGVFVELDEDAQLAAMRQFHASPLVPARTVLSLAAQCYYRDDRVLESIGLEARPPHPQGYEVEQGDWGLLDPVKARGPIYKEV